MIVQLPVNSNGSNGALRASCGTEAVSAAEKITSSSNSKRISSSVNNSLDKSVQETTVKVSKMADSATATSTTQTGQSPSSGNGCTSIPANPTGSATTNINNNSGTNLNPQTSAASAQQTSNSKSSSPNLSNLEEFGLTVGSIFSVQTCWDKNYEGEVMSFDYGSKILLIKCAATSGNPTREDVHMVNLNYVKHLEKKKSGKKDKPGMSGLRGLKIQKMEERKEQAVSERKKLAKAFNCGVREDGLKLFLHLNKTMGNSVSWRGTDMIVMNNVCISSPYRKENCAPNSPNSSNSSASEEANLKRSQEAVDYVKQLLDRYWNEN